MAVPRRASPPATARRRSATSSSFRTVQNGNNTQLKTQQNLGYDLGFDWTPNNTLKFSATGFYEFFKNELVTQATQVGAPNASFTFNAPKSEHRGVELAADWKFYPGWRFTAAYTYLDEVYTEYTENIVNGADVQLQPCRQQDSRHLAERTDGAARL